MSYVCEFNIQIHCSVCVPPLLRQNLTNINPVLLSFGFGVDLSDQDRHANTHSLVHSNLGRQPLLHHQKKTDIINDLDLACHTGNDTDLTSHIANIGLPIHIANNTELPSHFANDIYLPEHTANCTDLLCHIYLVILPTILI